MKKIITFCCALLGFGAMATAETSTTVIYTETKSVTITQANSHEEYGSYSYGEVNYYGATSLTQLAVYGAFSPDDPWGDIPSAEPEDIITATVKLNLDACTATNCIGLQIAFQGFNTGWGGWNGKNSTQINDDVTTSFELTSTVQDLMDANSIQSIDTYGGLALQIWNLGTDNGVSSDYFGAVATYTLTIEGVRDEGTSTAISSVSSDVEVTEVARYNLMGQKISGAEKGINIIVYSDGSSKKVLVK